jgi:hypothetical protein
MIRPRVILQIVPRVPGGRDGVGDYGQELARRLTKKGANTIFAAAQPPPTQRVKQEFPVLSPLRRIVRRLKHGEADAIILHYVNYGYDRRGIPLWLPGALAEMKGARRLLTVFHELYAIGTPWQSAFWFRPLQMRSARRIAHISDVALVSNGIHLEELERLSPSTPVHVRPVPSNLGEPELTGSAIEARDPHRWAICGGNELIRRSIHSFLRIAEDIESRFRPRELFVVGGGDQPEIAANLAKLKGIRTCYRPNVSAAEASEILSGCAFGWIDYFVQSQAPLTAILKSSAFAALCAHGVIAVFPRPGTPIAHENEELPGPFFVRPSQHSLPGESERGTVAQAIYSWYRRNALSSGLADLVWDILWPEPAPLR